MKTLYTRVFAVLLLVMAVAFGQIAQATTKTVIYRISSANYNQNYHCYEVGFSRADGSDMPFDGYENLYWMNIDESSLNNGGGSNGAGDYTVSFSDGFSLRLQWEAGSNAIISNQGGININAPSIDKYITYTVTGGSGRYFVTKIEMLNNEGNTGMSDINHHPMNPSFDYAYQLQEGFNSRASFGRIAITYTDLAPITLLTSPSANTYNITSKRDLAVLASYVNIGNNDCENLSFLQTQDINCDDTYVPIGYYNNENDFACFSGTYDGQSHYIRNITVNRTGNTDADSSVGLFGCISDGTVRNVILASSTFTGYNYVGGIVGFSNGNASGFTTVQNCRVNNSVVIHAGHSNALYHGGIVGCNYTSDAKVIGCFSGAAVSNNGKSGCEYFGGIVGKNDEGTIENCLYIGSIVTGDDKIGAITGYNAGSNLTNNYYNNINLGGVNSSDVDGARRARTVNLGEDVVIVGDPTVYNVSGITAIGTGNYAMRRGNNPIFSGATQTLILDYTGTAPDDYAFAGFSVKDSNNNDVAVTETAGVYTFDMPDKDVTVTAIIEIAPWSGDGTAESPFLIRTTLDLDRLATKVNEGNDYSDKFFLQTVDLVYDGTENNYVPIGRQLANTFNGVYDGGGHTISGIWVNWNDENVGLFGRIGCDLDNTTATVRNVALTDCTFAGRASVGGIVGLNTGIIYNCRVENSVNIYAGGDVSPRHAGIAGYNLGSVVGCVSGATVIENRVESTASRLYGGIVGNNTELYNNDCYTIVCNCLYTGTAVISDESSGAIIGGNMYQCFYTNNYYNTTSATVPLAVNGRDTIGARRARTITLGEGVILKGEETIYNVSGITAIGFGNHAIKYNDGNTTYIYSSVGYTVTLGAQEGYKLTSATLSYGGNDYNIEPDNGVFSFVMPDANVTVSATVEPGTPTGDHYELFSGDLVEGDYLIVKDGAAMSSMLMNRVFQYTNVTAIDDVITTDQTDIVWHIAPNDDRWTIYSAEAQKYAAYYFCYKVDLVENANDHNDGFGLWTVEGTSVYDFRCGGSYPYLRYHNTYGQIIGFDCSTTNTGGSFSLYKKVESPQTVTLDIAHYTPDGNDGWNLIASPLANDVFPTDVNGLTKNTYDLYRFNQAADAEWENWKADGSDHYHFDLEQGRGYLYANSEDVTLTFNGEHYSGDGTVTLTKTPGAEMEGWNLVGNPFAETAYIDRDFYVMNNDGSEIVLAERADYHVEAMEGIFVHADEDGETLTFITEAPSKGSGQKSEPEQLVINLSKGNRGSVIDRAIVRFDSKSAMQKLQIFDGSTKLYIPQDGTDYAMVSSECQSDIPLNFKAKEMGQYTISVETFPETSHPNAKNETFQETSLLDIKLIDRLEDVVVDLTENNRYTFIGSPTDRQERFIIVFAETQNFASLQGHFAYQNGAEIIITGEGELQIFDVMGRMIASRRVNGVETFPETSLQTGVYILKLNEQTQKIVVR